MMKVVVIEEHYKSTTNCEILNVVRLFYFFFMSGIGKNVNGESCSTRRALLAYQLSFETVENPRSSMPNLLIFLTFSKFVTLWPWPWDENEKSSYVGLCRCHWANQIPKPLSDLTNPLGEDANWNRLPPKNACFFFRENFFREPILQEDCRCLCCVCLKEV